MKFQIIYDFVQYDMSLMLIEKELVRRGWEIVRGKPNKYNTTKDVKGSLGCQSGSWIYKNPPIAPSFLTFHGVSFIKRWAVYYPTWDYIIVPSKFFEENLKNKTLGLGWSKADYYINNKDKQGDFREFVKRNHNIKDNDPIVLFAPTYNKKGGLQEPGNADKLMEVVKELPHCHVIFMPHEMCDYKNKYENYSLKVSCSYNKKVDYLLGCDLLISDTSSLVFEFALLDKPIVLLNNPKYPNYLRIAREKFDERLDLGEVVLTTDLSKLRKAVDDSLADPTKHSDKREYWVDKALGYCDGNSTNRIVDKIEEICGKAI